MAVTTSTSVPPLPPFPPAGKPSGGGRVPPPEGAAKMQTWYIDADGRRHRTPYEVPVDQDDHRTEHVRHQCPHQRNANGGGKEQCGAYEWLMPGVVLFCRQHGDQLQPPPSPKKARAGAVARDAYRMYGRSALPWTLPVAGGISDVVMDLAGMQAADALVATIPAAAVTYFAVKRTLTRRAIRRNRIERGQRTGRRVREIHRKSLAAAAVAGEAGLWATALAATDLSTWAGRIVAAAAMARWAIGAKSWWDRAEARRTRDGATQAPVQVEAPPADEPQVEAPDPVKLRALATWITLIGCAGGPLAGTELVDYKQLPACEVDAATRTRLPNWQAKVVAKVDGSINMRENRPTLLGRIAAAYRCTYADVSFSADESDLSVGWLRVQPDNVLAEAKLWPGPVANDWPKGRSRVGRYDDVEDIWYQWWTKTGAVHDLISGCTGSGKSELVAQLLLGSLHSNGLVLDWVGDPQGGQSYGHLKDAVDWFARDTSEIRLMLLAALKEMYRRNDELAKTNIKTWQPTKAMPLLVITLDEVQSILDDPIVLELVEKLVGQGRKCGIKMRLITQIPAAYNLGGSTYIKEQLKAGQTLIFRAMTDVAGRSAVDSDSPIDPTELPSKWGKNTCAAGLTTAGLMFVQGVNGRDVYGRADWTGDDMQVWLVDAAGNPTPSPGRFCAEAQRVSGVLWGDRVERAKKLLAAGRSDADLLSGGKAVELIESAAADWTPQDADAPASAPAPQPGKTPARDVVLAAAKEGADERGVVEKDTIVGKVRGKMAEGTCNKALTDLVADGSLRRIKNGLYEVTA